ncbi:myozenin-2a [Genypterus blacodes]|uniref:myozenin-2a n=1 Tax=Genypterus blacodes TaxID=154954 RepID=UPI003F76AF15
MSRFSTMTTGERKMQAAAICREIQGPEDVEMDLGKKVNLAKDIMLEELSLSSNRGSRLFKKRQKRSEKYTFESIQNDANKQAINATAPQDENGNAEENCGSQNDSGAHQPPIIPLDVPEASQEPSPDRIAPGYGGPLQDVPPEKFNCTVVPKAYFSPWEQAISKDPGLADTHAAHMPEPEPQPELPGYKSFNRVAIPFGGYNKAPTPAAPIELPPMDPLPDYPELQGEVRVNRPSFNRAALGWVATATPVFPTVSLDPEFIPESEDL